MNFTREPIIETIITPKEGFKLQVRNSKGGGQEEYLVDAVEVVSFGHSFFFRSLEKPKSFLVPVSDYEIVEVKEARVALKHAGPERGAIKISGGREAPFRPQREPSPERAEAPAEEREEEEVAGQPGQAAQGQREGRRRDRRRHRRRRGDRFETQEGGERTEAGQEAKDITPPEAGAEGGGASDETQVSSSMFTSLFPPPSTLISETLSRYKEKDSGLSEGGFFPKPIEEEERLKHEKKEDDDEDVSGGSSDSEGSQLSRVATTSMSFVQESFTSFTRPFSQNDYHS